MSRGGRDVKKGDFAVGEWELACFLSRALFLAHVHSRARVVVFAYVAWFLSGIRGETRGEEFVKGERWTERESDTHTQ